MSPDLEWRIGETADEETIVRTIPPPARWRAAAVFVAVSLLPPTVFLSFAPDTVHSVPSLTALPVNADTRVNSRARPLSSNGRRGWRRG